MNETVKIGKSDVMTTPMGLGTNAVGGHNLFPNLNNEVGIEIVKAALNGGVSLLDTAFVYGLGESEKLIGEAIKDYDRSKIQIATKGGQKVLDDGNIVVDDSPTHLKQCVEESLKRLQTDYLDIFYIHFPDKTTPLNEAIASLNELKQAGKIRAIGVSNFSMEQLKEANKDGLVDVDEEMYNLLHREAEKERFPYLRENNISFVPYFPLASGLLTGKYEKAVAFPKDDIRYNNPDFTGEKFAEIVDKVNKLKPISEKYHATIAQIVIAWYLKDPDISVVIPGAKTVKEVDSNVKSLDISLSDEDYKYINELFS